MTLLIVAVVAVAALAIGAAIAAARNQPDPGGGRSTPDLWLDRARGVVRSGYELAGAMSDAIRHSPTDLSEDAIVQILADVKTYNADVAALSATAPTAMDTRVCRNVGVRARGLCDPYERELRAREALGAGQQTGFGSDTLQQPDRLLEEFEVALRDLDEHVELL
jgi:hypothetical protein